ncbi:response regulator [Fischerella sp. PCC 9605]|uniref:response regulator n=1 Tax=Fischerella sp. PCC 9605 TaxID=1173024 RepID=UPI0004ACEBAB|nr:response regulator [Fischerella sp. PCC 9605]
MSQLNQSSHQRVKCLAPNQPVYRLLLIEDTWEHRQFLLKQLAPLGFEIREAENGEQGIAIWENWHPHLIFMDMQMPIMNGYEATREIRAREQSRLGEVLLPSPLPYGKPFGYSTRSPTLREAALRASTGTLREAE